MWDTLDPGSGVNRSIVTDGTIDFSKWMIVFLTIPRTSDGSYLAIQSAWDNGTSVEVTVLETRPTGPVARPLEEFRPVSAIALISRRDEPVHFHIDAADLGLQGHTCCDR